MHIRAFTLKQTLKITVGCRLCAYPSIRVCNVVCALCVLVSGVSCVSVGVCVGAGVGVLVCCVCWCL